MLDGGDVAPRISLVSENAALLLEVQLDVEDRQKATATAEITVVSATGPVRPDSISSLEEAFDRMAHNSQRLFITIPVSRTTFQFQILNFKLTNSIFLYEYLDNYQ